MLTLTKMKRAYVIDHIMPSDLDKNNIKHGLKLKEEMIAKITDDYIKSIIPEWRQIERDYRKRGVSQYMEKVNCGEMELDDIPKPSAINYDVWIRWKNFSMSDYNNNEYYGLKDYDYVMVPFEKLTCHITRYDEDDEDENFTYKLMTWNNNHYTYENVIESESETESNNTLYEFAEAEHNYRLKVTRPNSEVYYDLYDKDDNVLYFDKGKIKIECANEYRDGGYSEWIKNEENREFNFKDMKDTVFQMKIVLYGDNYDRYFPCQDYTHNNGWVYVSDELDLYDFEAGLNEPFYRMFFRNRPGYGDITYKGWFWENINWFRVNYPRLVDEDKKKVYALTIQSDPFRCKYNKPPPDPMDKDGFVDGSRVLLTGRQWVKTKYLVNMYTICNYSIHIDNTKLIIDT